MDDVVKVPAALVEALREAIRQESMQLAWNAALALVDAAERPDEGEADLNEVRKVWANCKRGWNLPRDVVTGMDVVLGAMVPVEDWFTPSPPPDPVGEPRPDEGKPLCKCGHDHQWSSGTILSAQGTVCGRCPCTAFTAAPLSSPRRTRDEGITLTDEERQALHESCWQGVALPTTFAAVESIIAARLDELEHEVEGLAWRNQQLTERLEKNHD